MYAPETCKTDLCYLQICKSFPRPSSSWQEFSINLQFHIKRCTKKWVLEKLLSWNPRNQFVNGSRFWPEFQSKQSQMALVPCGILRIVSSPVQIGILLATLVTFLICYIATKIPGVLQILKAGKRPRAPPLRAGTLASGKHTKSYEKKTIYSWFTYSKWWFSIAMLVYPRDPEGIPVVFLSFSPPLKWWTTWRLRFRK